MNTTSQFRALETDLSTFDICVDDIPIWERIRFGIFREIQKQSGVGQAHGMSDGNEPDYIDWLKLWLQNWVIRNPFLAPKSDIAFIGHQRRKKQPDGYWWDIYSDPIHEQNAFDSVHFERNYQSMHLTPPKTESLRYLDLITISGTIQQKLGFYNVRLSSKKRTRLKMIEEEIHNRFDADVDVVNRAKSELQRRQTRYWLYKKLLKRVDPQLVVVVVSYGRETIVEVCHELGIPVAELQHGVIYSDHLGYAFTGERSKVTFPDYLLTWGEFWGEGVNFPIPDDRVIPVGYPHLEQTATEYDDVESQEQILFISQGTIGEDLSKFALAIDQHSEIDHNIVYKLHPGEYDRWREEYPWLVDADFEIVDSSEPPLYELFAESSVQVGVYSTAIYEGLAFDLETYVYDCSGSDVLEPLIEEGSAKLISSIDDLATSLGTGKHSFESDYYFAPNATEKICEVLEGLANQGTQYRQYRY